MSRDEILFNIGRYVVSSKHVSGDWCAWCQEYPEDGPLVIGTLQEVVDEVVVHLTHDLTEDLKNEDRTPSTMVA